MPAHDLGLGRRAPSDWRHYERYPLTAATLPDDPVPVVIGVNWYEAFDEPEWDGRRWWIGRDAQNLGNIRGGHCVCLEPGDKLDATKHVVRRLQDIDSWYHFYDQGAEGACVGFGSSRMLTLLNRKTYDARWLWDMAKAIDEWDDTNPGDDNGTSVHAGMEVLRSQGNVVWNFSYEGNDWEARAHERPTLSEGILAYRWASTVDAVQMALKSPANQRASAVRILNSWGTGYPHRVWMPNETLQRLLDEDGEAAIVTDR